MSYVPFQQDVWPPAVPEIELRPKLRALRWACGIFLYLLAIAGWVYWMKLPPRIEPPLATIHLSDGTELRLVHCTVGPQLQMEHGSTFGNRIRLREGAFGGPWQTRSATGNGGWLVFTHINPRDEIFRQPDISHPELIEPGSPYALRPSDTHLGAGAPFVAFCFPVISRRSPTLTFNLTHAGKTQQATIPNPFLSASPQAPSDAPVGAVASQNVAPPPQQLQKGGFTARLEKVTFLNANSSSHWTPSIAEPILHVIHAEAKPEMFQKDYEWFDPSGNVVKRGVLPWSEPVWGLRLKISQNVQFPTQPEHVLPLGTITVPAPGQARALPVPADFRNRGVTDIFVAGAGTFEWGNNRLMVVTGAQKESRTTVLKLNSTPRHNSFSETNWGIYLLSTGARNSNLLGGTLLRVRKGEELFMSTSSGSSRSGSSAHQHFSNFTRQGSMLQAGDEMTIDLIKPATHVFEFLIPRPDFPADKALKAPKAP